MYGLLKTILLGSTLMEKVLTRWIDMLTGTCGEILTQKKFPATKKPLQDNKIWP